MFEQRALQSSGSRTVHGSQYVSIVILDYFLKTTGCKMIKLKNSHCLFLIPFFSMCCVRTKHFQKVKYIVIEEYPSSYSSRSPKCGERKWHNSWCPCLSNGLFGFEPGMICSFQKGRFLVSILLTCPTSAADWFNKDCSTCIISM